MTEYKKTWRVVSEEYESEAEAYNVYETINSTSVSGVCIEETTTPIVEWNSLGAISPLALGYGWRCSGCNKLHMFMTAYKDKMYNCKVCGKEHYSDWEE